MGSLNNTVPATINVSATVSDEELIEQVNVLINQNVSKAIYGVKWDKGSSPTLTRTDDASDIVNANVGVDFTSVTNEFDDLPIFGEFEEVVDDYGNIFIKIPKCYIRKYDGASYKSWQVSKFRHKGFYLPWCFWDFTNKKELPYILVGKHLASLNGDKLASLRNKYPLINTTIVSMRTYAESNNANGLLGYQQLDIHVVDLIRTLMFTEFATLDIQTIMQGFSTGQYSSSHTAIDDTTGNTIIVSNATGALYRVGQSISVGTSLGGNQIFYGRTITSIDTDTPVVGQITITFDGDSATITTGNILYNTGWRTGFSNDIIASSGSLVSNSDGKYPCMYRGIESPFADIWQFVDGLNINEYQSWVAKNADDYISNVFASPYEKLNYINSNVSNYVKEMGFDADNPFLEIPTNTSGGSNSTYYSDYYYQAAGQRIARFGGNWTYGSFVGLSYWDLSASSSASSVTIGGRLLKKPL